MMSPVLPIVSESMAESLKKLGFSDVTESMFHSQNAIGPWPMHEVVPRAVRAAVRMLMMTCRMVFQVSFFIILMRVFR